MGVAEPIKVIQDTVGSKGDPDVLDYVVRSLEDGDFDYGEEGQEAYDAFGEMLVSSQDDPHADGCMVHLHEHGCLPLHRRIRVACTMRWDVMSPGMTSLGSKALGQCCADMETAIYWTNALLYTLHIVLAVSVCYQWAGCEKSS